MRFYREMRRSRVWRRIRASQRAGKAGALLSPLSKREDAQRAQRTQKGFFRDSHGPIAFRIVVSPYVR